MSKPKPTLKLSDLRRVFRLVADVRRLGDEPNDWRPYMIQRLCRIFRAELVVSSEIYVLPAGEAGVWNVVDIGWGCDAGGQAWRIESTTREANPETYDILIKGETPADERLAIEPTEKMHQGRSFILSNQHLPHVNAIDQLGIHRGGGDGSPGFFTPADHRLLRILHAELGRFWRADVLARTRDPQRDLAPRLRQTLDLLVEGKSEKQIALALQISQHTVHNYVKALHQRFNVNSRGELLAAVNKQDKQFVPRLSREG